MFYKHDNYTVESVTSGHPDKICDQISDAILDAYLKTDPESRVAVETFGGHGKLVIGGEITSRGRVDCVKIAREVYKKIGYKDKLKISARYPVPGHCPRSGFGRSRRPGNNVWLCHQGDAGIPAEGSGTGASIGKKTGRSKEK